MQIPLKMTTFGLICIWWFLVAETGAFKPTTGQGDDQSMYTHESITQDGVDRAATKFLTSTGLFNTSTQNSTDIVKDYFGSDTKGFKNYQKRRQEFAAAVMNVYRSFHNDPDYTVTSERIREADNLVKSTRLEIASILSQGSLDDTSIHLLIDKVGKCLMIIQSFYSNTNWVEMMVNGGESFLNFGTLAPFNMKIAESGTDTCRNCDGSMPNACNNNLLVRNRLTSGYLYGQLYFPKPTTNPLAVEGKCSHGGVNDAGRNTAATGGINKETPDWNWSPHAHLHNTSGLTAVRATEAFFMDSASGLLRDVNQATIENIFKLNSVKQEKSMGFVVDVTGSMGDDIASVKASLIHVLSSVFGTENEPSSYVLSTFNDPATLTTVETTTDGQEMIHWIESLSVHGGDDCPEYAMSGILAAIDACKPHSIIYVATDADAKDGNLSSNVIHQANAKDITLKFLLTGSCSPTRRRRGIEKRGHSVFDALVSNTGGSMFNVNHSEVTAVLDNVLKNDFPSSEAIIDYFVLATSDPDTVNVTVDSEAAVLVITIKGPYSLAHASLALPNGTIETFLTTRPTQYFSSNTITMSIQRPTPGIWKLTRLRGKEWAVNVTAATYMYIDSQLKESDGSGISYVLDRNPITGKNYTLEILAYNLNSSSSSFAVNLVGEHGSIIYRQSVSLVFGSTKTTGYLSIVVPSKNFYVQLSGVDQNGFKFKRTSKTLIIPVGVDLYVQPIIGNLDIGKVHDITYTIRNLGDTDRIYTVSIVDNKGRVNSPTSREHVLVAGTSTTGHFQILSSIELEFVTYTVSVKLSGSPSVLQSRQSSVMFAGALCSSVISESCARADTGSNCSEVKWSATAIFSFDVSTYVSIPSVSMTLDSKDRKRLHVSGTCCLDNITVNAKPSFGSGCDTTLRVVVSDEETLGGNKEKLPHSSPIDDYTGVIVGIVVSTTIVVAVLVGGIVYKVHWAKTKKTKTPTNPTVMDSHPSPNEKQ
ncbi:LOW QUALITY PROTEIN: uncharacterized protein [Argopecten irradians]|uniref:LOW QUALITY PROTEIN: uncharacterized protein n=1 Tax=Argopecten irradians TaxID=31199 RepID=UPI0037216050